MTPLRIIVFEGLDRSGKSSIRKRFGERTGERFVTLARFLFSNAAYDIIFGRTTGPGVAAYLRAVEQMERDFGMLTVFVDTDPSVCAVRQLEERRQRYTVEVLAHHRRVFLDLIGSTSETRLVLNTEGKTVEQLTTDVIGWVQYVERRQA